MLLHCRDEIRIHGIHESVLGFGIVPFECCGVKIPHNNHGDFTFALGFAGRDVFWELLPEDFVLCLGSWGIDVNDKCHGFCPSLYANGYRYSADVYDSGVGSNFL